VAPPPPPPPLLVAGEPPAPTTVLKGVAPSDQKVKMKGVPAPPSRARGAVPPSPPPPPPPPDTMSVMAQPPAGARYEPVGRYTTGRAVPRRPTVGCTACSRRGPPALRTAMDAWPAAAGAASASDSGCSRSARPDHSGASSDGACGSSDGCSADGSCGSSDGCSSSCSSGSSSD
jgi:type IV secretory pathway VirB10-like protein